MIDTISFQGHQVDYFEKSTRAKFFINYEERNNPYLITDHFQGKNYRAFHDLNRKLVRIELSLPKAVCGQNCFNYANAENYPLLEKIIYSIMGQFFRNPKFCWINRIDLGYVQKYDTEKEKELALEHYKNTRPHSQRVSKFKHQNYSTSSFYYTKNYSIKVYDKFAESKYDNCTWTTKNMLRFEKTYRTGEMKRLGMESTPYMGIPVPFFSLQQLMNDFKLTFQRWEFGTKIVPIVTEKGLLGVLQSVKILSPDIYKYIETAKIASPSTFKRLKKIKSEAYKPKDLDFKVEIPPEFYDSWKLFFQSKKIQRI
jgi:hypothetical protein